MEMGMGFLVGAMVGGVTGVIIVVIAAAIKRAARGKGAEREKLMSDMAQAAGTTRRVAKSGRASTSAVPATGVTRRQEGGGSGHTMIVENVDNRDQRLNDSIQEVRGLLLKLADVLSSTETASGEAAVAFESAKAAIDGISCEGDELAEAQLVLIREIDRVLASNAKLHSELDRSKKGIAAQRRQIEELRQQARIDGLTRIPNRTALDERLAEYISLFDRNSLAFSLLLIDIDFFKRVNDEHGHINGDRILRGVAAKISAGIRTNDFAARYGGEEFAVIFSGACLDDAFTVADRMRADISRTNFRMDDKNLRLTISGGLAECKKGMTPESIIAAADSALYQAKSHGRNRVVPTPEKSAQ